MTPAQLSRTVLRAVRRAIEDGELSAPVPGRVVVERPRAAGRGDYATGIALQLARPTGQPPHRVAEILGSRLAEEPGIAGVEIADPGFLNITLDPASHTGLVRTILTQGAAYGHGEALRGQAIELSFPHEVRAAVTADALGRILRANGARVGLRCQSRPDPGWAGMGIESDAPAPRHTLTPHTGSWPRCSPPDWASGMPPRAPRTLTVRPVPARPHTAADLLRRLGPDATRWALLRPAAHDHPRITDDLLTQRESNPLFRVQYAHARVRALLRNAADLGVTPADGRGPVDGRGPADGGDPGHPAAVPLLAALGDFPAVVAAAARHRAPDRVARHLEATADAFFRYHDTCPVLPRGDEKPEAAHRARAALALAAGTVLAGGLHLLGVYAPDFL